jgi:hypothetical protein
MTEQTKLTTYRVDLLSGKEHLIKAEFCDYADHTVRFRIGDRNIATFPTKNIDAVWCPQA